MMTSRFKRLVVKTAICCLLFCTVFFIIGIGLSSTPIKIYTTGFGAGVVCSLVILACFVAAEWQSIKKQQEIERIIQSQKDVLGFNTIEYERFRERLAKMAFQRSGMNIVFQSGGNELMLALPQNMSPDETARIIHHAANVIEEEYNDGLNTSNMFI